MENLTQADLFWTIFAAVLSAGILIVTFVWGAVLLGREERGESNQRSYGTIAMAFLLPLFFGAGAIYITLGGG